MPKNDRMLQVFYRFVDLTYFKVNVDWPPSCSIPFLNCQSPSGHFHRSSRLHGRSPSQNDLMSSMPWLFNHSRIHIFLAPIITCPPRHHIHHSWSHLLDLLSSASSSPSSLFSEFFKVQYQTSPYCCLIPLHLVAWCTPVPEEEKVLVMFRALFLDTYTPSLSEIPSHVFRPCFDTSDDWFMRQCCKLMVTNTIYAIFMGWRNANDGGVKPGWIRMQSVVRTPSCKISLSNESPTSERRRYKTQLVLVIP